MQTNAVQLPPVHGLRARAASVVAVGRRRRSWRSSAQIAVPFRGRPCPSPCRGSRSCWWAACSGRDPGAAALVLYLAAGHRRPAGVCAGGSPRGLAQLLGPTGGYLLAFPVAAAVAGVRSAARGRLGRVHRWAPSLGAWRSSIPRWAGPARDPQRQCAAAVTFGSGAVPSWWTCSRSCWPRSVHRPIRAVPPHSGLTDGRARHDHCGGISAGSRCRAFGLSRIRRLGPARPCVPVSLRRHRPRSRRLGSAQIRSGAAPCWAAWRPSRVPPGNLAGRSERPPVEPGATCAGARSVRGLPGWVPGLRDRRDRALPCAWRLVSRWRRAGCTTRGTVPPTLRGSWHAGPGCWPPRRWRRRSCSGGCPGAPGPHLGSPGGARRAGGAFRAGSPQAIPC